MERVGRRREGGEGGGRWRERGKVEKEGGKKRKEADIQELFLSF